MRRSPSQFGGRMAGSTTKIRAVGFNGIAAITWVADAPMTNGKSNAGAPCVVTSPSFLKAVRRVRSIVAGDRDKRCCIGLMIHERFEAPFFVLKTSLM